MKSFCKDCAWALVGEELPFCEKMQQDHHTSCSRYYKAPDDLRRKFHGRKDTKCECGVDAAGGGQHSDYCPKYPMHAP